MSMARQLPLSGPALAVRGLGTLSAKDIRGLKMFSNGILTAVLAVSVVTSFVWMGAFAALLFVPRETVSL